VASSGLAPLAEIAHAERRMPAEFLGSSGQISDAFVTYARPLIGGDLPQYARLSAIAVQKGSRE
jgi:hypothetical protein